MQPGLIRTIALLAGMVFGALLPAAHAGAPAIQWLIIGMLFLVFLELRLSREAIHRSHILLLAVNVAMAFAAWGAGWLAGGRPVALAAFFAGITPTATAAAVVTNFLRGRVDYVVAAFLLTNVAIAALLPGLLPIVLDRAAPDVFVRVLGSVGVVVFIPMAAAWLLRLVHARAAGWPRHLRNVSFAMWILALFLITANASYFLRQHPELPIALIAKIAGLAGLVCAANFALGHLIGGRAYAREASQALGQKNTSLTIYLALTYADPVVALGPTSYVIWHNLWNSWQLHRQHRRNGFAHAERRSP